VDWLLNTWVKAPYLKNTNIVVASACLTKVNPGILEEFSKNKVVLLACPEQEGFAHCSKIAAIIRCSCPRSITVVTMEGSPHCYTLHAIVSEAVFLTGSNIKRKHFVVVNGLTLKEISVEAVRLARYLHLVDELLKTHPEVLKELKKLSLEQKLSK